jgi:ferritin-like protein
LLKELAARRGLSINKLVEEISTIAIAEYDAYTRFKAMAASGSREEGLRLLAKLDVLEANEHANISHYYQHKWIKSSLRLGSSRGNLAK